MMLTIKNMESERCKSYVQNELIKLGIPYKYVELGEVKLKENISREKLEQMDMALRYAGLEIIPDKKTILVDKIKSAIHQLVYFTDEIQKPNISRFICNRVNSDYSYLSKLFAAETGTTIEKYIISEKIERVKKLIVCYDLSLVEITYKMQYSSVAHLSSQFKKITGLTPSGYKKKFLGKPIKCKCKNNISSTRNCVTTHSLSGTTFTELI